MTYQPKAGIKKSEQSDLAAYPQDNRLNRRDQFTASGLPLLLRSRCADEKQIPAIANSCLSFDVSIGFEVAGVEAQ